MKNSLNSLKYLLFFILFIGLIKPTAQAQNFPFPVEDAVWVNQYQNYYHNNGTTTITFNEVNNFCANGLDSTINNVAYKQLNICTASSSNYYGAIRDDAGQVYFVPKDSLTELLIYDFTLNEGDHKNVYIQNPWPGDHSFNSHNITIDNIDTVMVNGLARKIFYTLNAAYPIIEGIGSTSGLFQEPYPNISNYFVDLMCMSLNDTTYYNYDNHVLTQGEPGTCDLTLNIQEAEGELAALKVFPNPNQGNFILTNKGGHEIEKVRLYNLYGQVINTQNMGYSTEISFEIESASGMYLLEILSVDGNRTLFKIIKE